MKLDFTLLKDAAREAIKSARGTSGIIVDPELAQYNKLQPAHFPALIEKYGVDNVLRYIEEMERRKATKEG